MLLHLSWMPWLWNPKLLAIHISPLCKYCCPKPYLRLVSSLYMSLSFSIPSPGMYGPCWCTSAGCLGCGIRSCIGSSPSSLRCLGSAPLLRSTFTNSLSMMEGLAEAAVQRRCSTELPPVGVCSVRSKSLSILSFPITTLANAHEAAAL